MTHCLVTLLVLDWKSIEICELPLNPLSHRDEDFYDRSGFLLLLLEHLDMYHIHIYAVFFFALDYYPQNRHHVRLEKTANDR